MLTIENLIWVFPGLIGLWAYNSLLVVKLPQGEGWKYLLLVVFFALPYYLITKIIFFESPYAEWFLHSVSYFSLGILGGTVIAWITRDKDKNMEYILILLIFVFLFGLILFMSLESENKKVIALLTSIPISAVFGWSMAVVSNNIIKNRDMVFDPFHDSCSSWGGKLVFITLKNNKVYLGMFVDHTKIAGFNYTIKIIPAYSGYRNKVGNLCWEYKYPIEKDTLVKMIIPQSEITTFTLWNDSEKFENRPSEVLNTKTDDQ